METNSTPISQPSSNGQQQASGASLFWGLAAIALNAMLQPSFTSTVCSGDLFKDSLIPHRSSPFVCLTDAAADIWLIVRNSRRAQGTQNGRPRASPVTVSLRLATFLFGVLPQAIQLFSAQGIPITQAIAAMLLLSTVICMARTLHLADGQKDLVDGQRDISDILKPSLDTDEEEIARVTTSRLRGIVVLAGLVPQAWALSYVWAAIASHARVEVHSENVVRWAHLIGELSLTLGLLYLIQHGVCYTIWKKLFLPKSVLAGIVVYGRTYLLPYLLTNSSLEPSKRTDEMWIPLYSHAALCSWFVAAALKEVSSRFLNISREQGGTAGRTPRMSHESQPDEQPGANSVLGQSNLSSLVPDEVAAQDDPVHEGDTRECSQSESPVTEASPQPQGSHGIASSTESAQSPLASVLEPTTTPGEVTTDQPDGNNHMPFWMWIIVVPGVVVLILLTYAGLFPLSSDEQEAAEEGTASPELQPTEVQKPEAALSEPSRLKSSVRKLVHLLNTGLSLAVRYLILTVWRLLLAIFSGWGYSGYWIWAKLENGFQDTLWLAFGILNVSTAAIYYLLIFDGEGTYMPSWTNLLG